MSISSISSVSTSSPVKLPDPAQSSEPDVQASAAQSNVASSNPANDNDDASEAPKPTPAPLPPGQGTRIDQLV